MKHYVFSLGALLSTEPVIASSCDSSTSPAKKLKTGPTASVPIESLRCPDYTRRKGLRFEGERKATKDALNVFRDLFEEGLITLQEYEMKQHEVINNVSKLAAAMPATSRAEGKQKRPNLKAKDRLSFSAEKMKLLDEAKNALLKRETSRTLVFNHRSPPEQTDAVEPDTLFKDGHCSHEPKDELSLYIVDDLHDFLGSSEELETLSPSRCEDSIDYTSDVDFSSEENSTCISPVPASFDEELTKLEPLPFDSLDIGWNPEPDIPKKIEAKPFTNCSERVEKIAERKFFWQALHRFLGMTNKPIGVYPCIACKPLDLYCLYIEVTQRGGYNRISTENGLPVKWSEAWEEIYRSLVPCAVDVEYNPRTNENIELSLGDIRLRREKLKHYYEEYLLGFELSKALHNPIPGNGSANFVRCCCGHSHSVIEPDCVTCKIELEMDSSICDVNNIQCEACGAWQHIQCLLAEQMKSKTDLRRLEKNHFYCEMCLKKEPPVQWSTKLLQFELPPNWTSERRFKNDGIPPDYYSFKPGDQMYGRDCLPKVILSHSQLAKALREYQ